MNAHDDDAGLAPPVGRPALSADPTADASAFPPPAPASAPGGSSGITPSVATPEEATTKRPVVVIVAVVVGLVALAVAGGGWLAFRDRGGGSASAPTAGLTRLPSDPTERYSVKFDPDVSSIPEVAGTPDRVVATVSVDEGDQLRVLGPQGSELWRRDLAADAQVEMTGDDVLIFEPSGLLPDGEITDAQLTLVDGDTGDELWSNVLTEFGRVQPDQVTVRNQTVMLFWFVPPTPTIAAYDLATGEKVAEQEFQYVDPLSSLPQFDGVIVIDDDELFVVDERVEDITERLSREVLRNARTVAYADGEILVAGDRELTRYRNSSESESVTAEFDVDDIRRLIGTGDSNWVYFTDDTCGAVRFSGDKVEQLWKLDTCTYNGTQTVTLFENADPMLMMNADAPVVFDAATGEQVHAAAGLSLHRYANGFVDYSRSVQTGYSWPGGDELFSIQLGDDQYTQMLDNGYAILDTAGDEATLTVYG